MSLHLIQLPQREWKSCPVIICNKVCGRHKLPAASYNSHCRSNYYNWCGSILIPALKQYPTLQLWDYLGMSILELSQLFCIYVTVGKKLLIFTCSLPPVLWNLTLFRDLCVCVWIALWIFTCLCFLSQGDDHRVGQGVCHYRLRHRPAQELPLETATGSGAAAAGWRR